MGFPTDIRAKNTSAFYGIDGTWANSGTDLANNATNTVLPATNKAGRLNSVYVMSKSPEVFVYVELDGVNVLGGFKERPSWLMARHGACGEFGYVVLDRYDTTNGKYIMIVEGPLEYGNAMEVKLKNPNTGAAIKCNAVVDYMENT